MKTKISTVFLLFLFFFSVSAAEDLSFAEHGKKMDGFVEKTRKAISRAWDHTCLNYRRARGQVEKKSGELCDETEKTVRKGLLTFHTKTDAIKNSASKKAEDTYHSAKDKVKQLRDENF